MQEGWGNVEQAAEDWRIGIVGNEDVALGASFCGHARPEQTSAQLLSFPADVKVNRTNSQSNFQVGLTLCGLFPCQPLGHLYILMYNKGKKDARSSSGRVR